MSESSSSALQSITLTSVSIVPDPMTTSAIASFLTRASTHRRHMLVIGGPPDARMASRRHSPVLLEAAVQHRDRSEHAAADDSSTLHGRCLRSRGLLRRHKRSGNGRNTGIGFYFFGLNARLICTFALTERVKLETIAEAFDALTTATTPLRMVRSEPGRIDLAPTNISFGQATAARGQHGSTQVQN